MMVMASLSGCSPIFLSVSLPSIMTSPWLGSTRRKRAEIKDDLPAPVLPTMPIYIGRGQGGKVFFVRKRDVRKIGSVSKIKHTNILIGSI